MHIVNERRHPDRGYTLCDSNYRNGKAIKTIKRAVVAIGRVIAGVQWIFRAGTLCCIIL